MSDRADIADDQRESSAVGGIFLHGKKPGLLLSPAHGLPEQSGVERTVTAALNHSRLGLQPIAVVRTCTVECEMEETMTVPGDIDTDGQTPFSGGADKERSQIPGIGISERIKNKVPFPGRAVSSAAQNYQCAPSEASFIDFPALIILIILMKRCVVKFGGSNFKNAGDMAKILQAVRLYPVPPIIVVSAFYGITNDLIAVMDSPTLDEAAIEEMINGLKSTKRESVEQHIDDPEVREEVYKALRARLDDLSGFFWAPTTSVRFRPSSGTGFSVSARG